MKAFRLLLIGAIFLLAAECELLDDTGLTVAERLEGRWHVEDTELKSADDWYYTDIYISSVDSNRIIIDNFHDLQVGSLYANIVGMKLIVPQQEVGNGFIMEGSADISITFNQLTWSYKVDDGSGFWTDYSATYTKVEGY